MKKFAVMLVSMLMIAAILCSGALACSSSQARTLYRKVDAANAKVLGYVVVAQLTPYNDIPWLLASVDKVTKPVIAYAESIGAKVECRYTYYLVDGKWVAIDPLRVVNVGD